MDHVAALYVKLVLALGRHDPSYVDAYYGPAEWKAEADATVIPLDDLRAQTAAALDQLQSAEVGDHDLGDLRKEFLHRQLASVAACIDLCDGIHIPFDEESAALYNVRDAGRDEAYYADALARLDGALPGTGSIVSRLEAVRPEFYVPREKLETVFRTATEAARERTRAFIPLPDHETFELELVTNQVWGGYNWYKGNGHSLIQVNTDFQMSIDRVVPLACHEGYPGHHVYNLLLEQELAKGRQWVEFTVYPLFSPQSLIAEGTAEYGIELAFPDEVRAAFERDVLYPLAGIPAAGQTMLKEIADFVGRLNFISTDAARHYLDGTLTYDQTVDWLITYGPMSRERAIQRLQFIEANRSYVVTYVLGLDLVRRYVESQGTTEAEKWRTFTRILSTPQTPGALVV